MTETPPLNQIKQIGIIDYNDTEFHKMNLQSGNNYNAYLIKSETQGIIIDTVPEIYAHQFLLNISHQLPFSAIKHIIINHAEQESSGSILTLMRKLENATIHCSHKCLQTLKYLYPDIIQYNFNIISRQKPLIIHDLIFDFIQVPLLHWPDSTMTYCHNLQTLFSSDIFSSFQNGTLADFALKLFGARKSALVEVLELFDVVTLQTARTQELESWADTQGLETCRVAKQKKFMLKEIYPCHGTALTSQQTIQDAFATYREICTKMPKKHSAVIAYDSFYGNSVRQAQLFSQFLSQRGVVIHAYALNSTPLGQIVSAVNESQFVIVGSPVYNQDITPLMVEFLALLQSIDGLQGKASFSFGSYGWNAGILEGIFREELCDAGEYMGHIEYKMGQVKDYSAIGSICDKIFEKIEKIAGSDINVEGLGYIANSKDIKK